jgi:hypothetical protein
MELSRRFVNIWKISPFLTRAKADSVLFVPLLFELGDGPLHVRWVFIATILPNFANRRVGHLLHQVHSNLL